MAKNGFYFWFLVAILAVIDSVWLAREDMALTGRALLLVFMPVIGLAALAWVYTKIRPNPRIAGLAQMSAVTLAFMSATCILSYLMVTLRAPLVDPRLAAMDRALGLDWLGIYRWIVARPLLHTAMQVIYMSLIPQIIVVQTVLNFRGQIARAWESLWAFIFACLGCVVVSGLLPAAGAFVWFHVQLNEPYVREFAALRDGSVRLIGGPGGLQGVVEFPSLHMALAILFPYALRGVPVAFPLLATLDALVIIATAPIGGHHFADLWGGALLALLSIWLVRRPFMAGLLTEPKSRKKKTPKKNTGRAARPSPHRTSKA